MKARSLLPEDSQMAAFLSEKAEDFIERNKQAPFMLYVSTFEPHSPYADHLTECMIQKLCQQDQHF